MSKITLENAGLAEPSLSQVKNWDKFAVGNGDYRINKQASFISESIDDSRAYALNKFINSTFKWNPQKRNTFAEKTLFLSKFKAAVTDLKQSGHKDWKQEFNNMFDEVINILSQSNSLVAEFLIQEGKNCIIYFQKNVKAIIKVENIATNEQLVGAMTINKILVSVPEDIPIRNFAAVFSREIQAVKTYNYINILSSFELEGMVASAPLYSSEDSLDILKMASITALINLLLGATKRKRKFYFEEHSLVELWQFIYNSIINHEQNKPN